MNFYDRYWTIEFKDKKDFFKNYFEIMCNYKYNSRIIDDIFHKNEISKRCKTGLPQMQSGNIPSITFMPR